MEKEEEEEEEEERIEDAGLGERGEGLGEVGDVVDR